MAVVLIAFSLMLINLELLPAMHWLTIVAIVVVFNFIAAQRYPLAVLVLLGAVLAIARYESLTETTLNLNSLTRVIEGQVLTIPENHWHAKRFHFQTEKINHQPNRKRLNLLWYGRHPYIQVKDQWQFEVRFSTQKKPWLQHQGVSAQAYIKHGYLLRREHGGHSISVLRQHLAHKIKQFVKEPSSSAVLVALALGSRHLMKKADWQVFQNTGTSHLVAISGLHVGLVAALFYWLSSWLWRRSSTLMHRLPTPKFALLVSLCAATAYAMLSGFAVPAQRALIMLAVLSLGRLSDRVIPLWYRLLLAFSLVLAHDPRAVYSASCWLSFAAVALIGYSLNSGRGLFAWLRLQVMMCIGLLPLTLLFFQRVSLVMLAANLVAIPYTSFLLVPGCLIATVGFLLPASLSKLLWQFCAHLLQPLWWYLGKLAGLPHAVWQHSINPTQGCLMLLGVFILLAPTGFPARWLGLLFLIVN